VCGDLGPGKDGDSGGGNCEADEKLREDGDGSWRIDGGTCMGESGCEIRDVVHIDAAKGEDCI